MYKSYSNSLGDLLNKLNTLFVFNYELGSLYEYLFISAPVGDLALRGTIGQFQEFYTCIVPGANCLGSSSVKLASSCMSGIWAGIVALIYLFKQYLNISA